MCTVTRLDDTDYKLFTGVTENWCFTPLLIGPQISCRLLQTCVFFVSFQSVCEQLQLEDLDELDSRLEYQNIAVEGFPKLEDLVVQIADVVEPSLARNHKTNKHRVWCSKHWKNIITRLETWRQQSRQIPVSLFGIYSHHKTVTYTEEFAKLTIYV